MNENMLETPEERIKLLKAGISARDIEKLYIIYNDLKVVRNPVLYEFNNHACFANDPWMKVRYLMSKSSRQ